MIPNSYSLRIPNFGYYACTTSGEVGMLSVGVGNLALILCYSIQPKSLNL